MEAWRGRRPRGPIRAKRRGDHTPGLWKSQEIQGCVVRLASTVPRPGINIGPVVPTFWGKSVLLFFFQISNVHGVPEESYLYLKSHMTERKDCSKHSDASERICILFSTTPSEHRCILRTILVRSITDYNRLYGTGPGISSPKKLYCFEIFSILNN